MVPGVSVLVLILFIGYLIVGIVNCLLAWGWDKESLFGWGMALGFLGILGSALTLISMFAAHR